MQAHTGMIARLFGPVFGTGPGSGMSLLIFLSGIAAFLVGLAGYFIAPIRDAETVLPDHEPAPSGEAAPA